MRRAFLILAAQLCLASLTIAAQPAGTLLFTTLDRALTMCPKPSSLQNVESADVMRVIPPTRPATPCVDADKWAPKNAWCALVGDHKNGLDIYDDGFAGRRIDALLWTLVSDHPAVPSMRDVYISPAATVYGNVSGVNADPGDVFRVKADGKFVFFLTAAQIRGALQMTATSLNLDAVALARHPTYSWVIYLSLDNTHNVVVANGGSTVAQDGAILALPVKQLSEPVVLTGTAFMVATEAQMSSMAAASGVRDAAGQPVTTIGDTDGLHADPQGGTFQNNWGVWNNLWFCGENLTGGAVLSTNSGGSFAVLNGTPLSSKIVTDGTRVGLYPSAGSLNALHVHPAPLCAFATETPTPVLGSSPGTLQLDVGGASPAPGSVYLAVGATDDSTPIVAAWRLPPAAVTCFPEAMNPNLWIFSPTVLSVPIDAQGNGSFVRQQAILYHVDVYVQAFNWDPVARKVRVSTPMTFE